MRTTTNQKQNEYNQRYLAKKKRAEKSIMKNVEGIEELLPMDELMSYPQKKQKVDVAPQPLQILENQDEDESPS